MKRDFNTLDPSSLKAFHYSALSLNFTKAAALAGLTQSGVSQHIQKLETEFKTLLFDRSKRKLKLTEAGEELYQFTLRYQDRIADLYNAIESKTHSFVGQVSYAMPDSCLKTPHLGLLLNQRREFDGIDLKINLLGNNQIFDSILNDQIDFGFLTKKIPHHSIEYHQFANEDYLCVYAPKYLEINIKKNDFAKNKFIHYPGMDVYLELWQQSQLPSKKGLNIHAVHIAGDINDLDGAITFCSNGVGIGFFPRHCIEKELKKGILKEITFNNKPTSHPIYIAHKPLSSKPKRVKKILDAFWIILFVWM